MERRTFLGRGLAVTGGAAVAGMAARPAGAGTDTVRAVAGRAEVHLAGGVSGGILEWRIDRAQSRLRR